MISKLQQRLAELASQREALLARTPDAELQRLAAEEEALRAELEAAEREEAKRRLAEIRQITSLLRWRNATSRLKSQTWYGRFTVRMS